MRLRKWLRKYLLSLKLVLKVPFRFMCKNIRNLSSAMCVYPLKSRNTVDYVAAAAWSPIPFLERASCIIIWSPSPANGIAWWWSQGLPSCLLLFVSSCMEHRQLHCWAWLECGGCSRMWFSYQREPGTISLLSGFVSFRDSFVLLLPSSCDRTITSTEIFRVESRCWKISFIQQYHRVSNFFEVHLTDLYCPQ